MNDKMNRLIARYGFHSAAGAEGGDAGGAAPEGAAPDADTTDEPGSNGGAPADEPEGAGGGDPESDGGDDPESDGGDDDGDDPRATVAAADLKVEDLKVPDTLTFSQEDLSELGGILADKDGNIPEGLMQRLVDYQSKRAEALAKQQETEYADIVKGWEKEISQDKEFGGAHFEANMDRAIAAKEKFSDPDLDKFLDTTGYGSHPMIVKLFYRIGLAMAEDQPGGRGGQPPQERDKTPQGVADRLYGNTSNQ